MFCPPEGSVSDNVNMHAMMFSEEKHIVLLTEIWLAAVYLAAD